MRSAFIEVRFIVPALCSSLQRTLESGFCFSFFAGEKRKDWIPAFAGMTDKAESRSRRDGSHLYLEHMASCGGTPCHS